MILIVMIMEEDERKESQKKEEKQKEEKQKEEKIINKMIDIHEQLFNAILENDYVQVENLIENGADVNFVITFTVIQGYGFDELTGKRHVMLSVHRCDFVNFVCGQFFNRDSCCFQYGEKTNYFDWVLVFHKIFNLLEEEIYESFGFKTKLFLKNSNSEKAAISIVLNMLKYDKVIGKNFNVIPILSNSSRHLKVSEESNCFYKTETNQFFQWAYSTYEGLGIKWMKAKIYKQLLIYCLRKKQCEIIF